MPTAVTAAEIEKAVRNVPDFPKPGVQFKDITPVLADARLFAGTIDLLTQNFAPGSVDAVVDTVTGQTWAARMIGNALQPMNTGFTEKKLEH